MDRQDLMHKLAQIEEQAKDTLAGFPQLAKERLRMIMALARYVRSEIAADDSSAPESKAGLRAGPVDDENVGSA